MSSTTPLRMYRGDTQAFDVTVADRDTGIALDITPYQLRFTAKYRTADTDDEAIIVKTDSYGGITFGYEEGQAIIIIDPADTIDLTKTTTLLWDLQLTDAFGQVKTAAAGRLIIYADVSITAP